MPHALNEITQLEFSATFVIMITITRVTCMPPPRPLITASVEILMANMDLQPTATGHVMQTVPRHVEGTGQIRSIKQVKSRMKYIVTVMQ